jgi:DNA-binding NarL/FixJ family response regulator
MNTSQPRDVILIVDDTPANLAYLSDALNDAGYKVLVALDGRTALDTLRLVTPDIILLDAVMPGIDGFDTCGIIKSNPATRDIPVVFMTALVDTPHVVRAFEAGAIDYVTKPVCQEEMLARLVTHIGRARALHRAQKSVEACGRAGMTVDVSGNITWQTPRAQGWLAEYCAKDAAPYMWSRLRAWIHSIDEGKASPSGLGAHFALTQQSGQLTIHYAGKVAHGEHLLLLQEDRADVSAQRLSEGLKLTVREAEVLNWLAAGKTDRDIAAILQISPRTVNKHLEHIYPKLGVETRAAAAAVASRLKASPSYLGTPPA